MDHENGKACSHRHCAIPKLVLLIKLASKRAPEDMTEEDIINIGIRSLRAIGVAEDEIVEATTYLMMSSIGLV